MTTFAELADHVATTQTVAIITARRDGREVATPIWAVVVEGVPYVRSAYGERAAWNRRARSGRPVAFTLADGSHAEGDAAGALRDPRLAVSVALVPLDSAVQADVDATYRAKYAGMPAELSPLLTDDARALTLRIEPAAHS